MATLRSQRRPRPPADHCSLRPYDLSVIQVFYGGEAYPDAEPLDLESPPPGPGQVSRTPTITTNLNFLELAKRQYDEELRERLGAMRFPCPKEEETAK